jgi:hypothetical protein
MSQYCRQLKIASSDKNYDIQLCKSNLMDAKKQIEKKIKKYGQKQWDVKTRWMENSAHILKYIKSQESSLIPRNISNAFLKCWELLEFIKLYFIDQEEINHFDNASLPGDFIRATQTWLNLNYPNIKYEWMANSLIAPDALEDRFDLMKNNPDKWMMDEKMDGDISDMKNIDYIASKLKYKIDLYTSDLGFNMIDKYKEEELHQKCNIGQILLGLKILKIGGIMIIKQFTMFTIISQYILLNLKNMFNQVWIVKPETSKSDNSEIYIVCIDYIHTIPNINLSEKSSINIKDTNLEEIISETSNRQVAKIKQNINNFTENKESVYNKVDCQSWCMKYNLDNI